MMRFFPFIFTFFAILATGAENLSSWQKQMPITFSGYTPPGGNETLANFPVLVIFSNTTAGAGFAYSDFLSPPYDDLRFAASDKTTPLNFEVEKWDVSGNSYVWVQVPVLAGTNTRILAFWGKSGVSAPACTTNGDVWINGFNGVWHLGLASATQLDSTANGNNATPSGGVVAGVVGKIAGAVKLDGINGYLSVPHNASIAMTDNFTAEVWFKRDAFGVFDGFLSKESAAYTKGWSMVYNNNSPQNFAAYIPAAYRPCNATGVQNDFTWHHMVMRLQNGLVNLFLDGVQQAATSAATITDSGKAMLFGKFDFDVDDHYHNGLLDEIRVSNVPRSANWVWASFFNMAENGTFNTYAPPELGGAPRIVNSNAVVGAAFVTLSGALISAGEDSNVLASVFWGTNDAGNNMAGWTYANWFPGWSTVGSLSTNVALTGPAGTRYFYRFFASNSLGSAWASPVGSFSSLGAPSVNNAGGVTDMGFFSATLHGEVLGGNPMPCVRIYWGRANQGMNKALWEHETLVDEFSSWAFAATIEGLTPDVTHYYTCYASNSYGEAWSPAVTAFTPGLGKVHYVDKANPLPPGSPYLTWASAATNIQDAIDVAVAGELVLVTNGVYDTGSRVAGAMNSRVAITNAIIVMAGSTNPADTIITGAPDPGTGGIGAGAIRGVYVGTNAQLIGFTISNGNSAAWSATANGSGGGVYAAANSLVSNCAIVANQGYDGAGVYAAANSIVSDCFVLSNHGYDGCGIFAAGNNTVRGCKIKWNYHETAAGGYAYGGGVYAAASSIISNCAIMFNTNCFGGGVYGGSSYNCQISYNYGAVAAVDWEAVIITAILSATLAVTAAD